ncbi:MAG: hypothetical protein Ct9H300mP27_05650 [Chloroflexota bacterium]|nr:MAG: hypothetical protein Ct9H300mP27_05650 [Chloroflexota bacterium]
MVTKNQLETLICSKGSGSAEFPCCSANDYYFWALAQKVEGIFIAHGWHGRFTIADEAR